MFITPITQQRKAERERESQWDTHVANSCPNQVIQNPTGNSHSENYRGINNQTETSISCFCLIIIFFVDVADLLQLHQLGKQRALPTCPGALLYFYLSAKVKF